MQLEPIVQFIVLERTGVDDFVGLNKHLAKNEIAIQNSDADEVGTAKRCAVTVCARVALRMGLTALLCPGSG